MLLNNVQDQVLKSTRKRITEKYDGLRDHPMVGCCMGFVSSHEEAACHPLTLIFTLSVSMFVFSASAVKLFYLSIRFANYGTENVQITTSDKNPSAGFVIKPRTIVQITKNVTNMDPVTFWAKASDHSCVLNNQPSLIVIPVEKMGIWKVVNITDKCKLVSSF